MWGKGPKSDCLQMVVFTHLLTFRVLENWHVSSCSESSQIFALVKKSVCPHVRQALPREDT